MIVGIFIFFYVNRINGFTAPAAIPDADLLNAPTVVNAKKKKTTKS